MARIRCPEPQADTGNAHLIPECFALRKKVARETALTKNLGTQMILSSGAASGLVEPRLLSGPPTSLPLLSGPPTSLPLPWRQ